MGENLLLLLTAPRLAVRRLMPGQPVGLALFVLFFAQISASAAYHLAMRGSGSLAAIAHIMLMGLVTLIGVFAGTAALHLFATLFGGRGDPGQLLFALMTGDAPWLLAAPAMLAALGVSIWHPGYYLPLLFVIMVGLSVWSVGLKTYSVAALYGLSGGRALFVFFGGYGSVVLLSLAAMMTVPVAWLVWISVLVSK